MIRRSAASCGESDAGTHKLNLRGGRQPASRYPATVRSIESTDDKAATTSK
jgi:hypothetical protein